MSLRVLSLPYQSETRILFARIADQPWAIWLDSGTRDGQSLGRYDILSAAPSTTLLTQAGRTRITDSHGVREHHENPLQLLRECLAQRSGPAVPGIPFAGGAMGYWGYDLAAQIDRQPVATGGAAMPEMAVGLYDWALIVDHQARTTHLVTAAGLVDPASLARHWAERLYGSVSAHPEYAPFRVTGPVSTLFSEAAYRAVVEQVQAYIAAGDCYQVNVAQRLSVPVEGDAWQAYCLLRQINPAPYGAFMRYPGGAVLSTSPEQFLSLKDGVVTTRPIKGTRRRDPDPLIDNALRDELIASPKDRAENLMIVDLLRNDLGRVCVPGSVTVPELFKPESYARVHHLVSTVTGRLTADQDAVALLEAAFPGGSITGAPKRRAMEIIAELEGCRRGAYCGSMGWISDAGDMDTNIAIRTAVQRDDHMVFWAGGGIVSDSRWDAEYQECQTKATPFFELLRRCAQD